MIVIGLLTVELQIPASGSLKEKRQVLRSVVRRIQNDFNVSIAEVDHQDSWQLATLAVTCVSSDHRVVQRVMQHVVNTVERGRFGLVLLDYETELI